MDKHRRKLEQRKKYLAWQEQDRVEHNEMRREMNTRFLFWTECSQKACARARRCASATPDDCFKRWWPVVPEEIKVEFRAIIIGTSEKGMSLKDAAVYAKAEVARWRSDQERWGQQKKLEKEEQTTPAAAPLNVSKTGPAAGPRVRSL